MTVHSIGASAESYRRVGTAQRTLTLAPGVPSQDVTRYQAQDMPAPTYDLERKRRKISSDFRLLFRTYGPRHT